MGLKKPRAPRNPGSGVDVAPSAPFVWCVVVGRGCGWYSVIRRFCSTIRKKIREFFTQVVTQQSKLKHFISRRLYSKLRTPPHFWAWPSHRPTRRLVIASQNGQPRSRRLSNASVEYPRLALVANCRSTCNGSGGYLPIRRCRSDN